MQKKEKGKGEIRKGGDGGGKKGRREGVGGWLPMGEGGGSGEDKERRRFDEEKKVIKQ